MRRYGVWVEDVPTNATGPNVPGTGDDDSTVIVRKKPKIFKRKRRMTDEEIKEARNYAKERENYHSKPEEMERNAARSKARRLMIKNGKAARGDGKDVHHKDNNPLNNEDDNLKMTTQAWNRREPRLRKEESINISERELTSTELKRREEIATDLDDAKFKEKYGDKWKQVKMGVATNMAKKESIEEADDPKADKAKAKELKIAKAIAQAQLAIAKEQERVQKLTDLQNKVKDQQSEETTMSKKYLNTKKGSIEDAVKQVWQNAADTIPATPPTVENRKVKQEEEEVQPEKKSSSVDGRTKSYKETLKRIATRKERLNAMKKSSKAMEHVTNAIDEEDDLDEAKFRPGDIKKALKIAYDMEGDMTGAWKKIEKMKRGLGDDPTVQAALKDANEEVVHEAVKGHFDVSDPKEMKKSLAKFRLKGKISQKHVNAGYDEWEVSGKSIEDIWAWYHKSGYGDKDDFDDMDDFKDTHFESRIHHRAMMTEGNKEEYQKFFQAALKKFGAKSPADMDDEKKKKFFDYIDKNWTKEEQQEFTEGELPPALKKAIAAKKAKNGDTEDEDKDPVGKKESWKKDVMKKPASGVKKGFKDKKDKKDEKEEVKEATKYAFPTLSSSADEVDDAKKIAGKLKRVYKDTKIKNVPGGAASGGKGWQITFTDKEDNPKKVLKALQKTGYDDGDMDTDDLESYAEGFEKKK